MFVLAGFGDDPPAGSAAYGRHPRPWQAEMGAQINEPFRTPMAERVAPDGSRWQVHYNRQYVLPKPRPRPRIWPITGLGALTLHDAPSGLPEKARETTAALANTATWLVIVRRKMQAIEAAGYRVPEPMRRWYVDTKLGLANALSQACTWRPPERPFRVPRELEMTVRRPGGTTCLAEYDLPATEALLAGEGVSGVVVTAASIALLAKVIGGVVITGLIVYAVYPSLHALAKRLEQSVEADGKALAACTHSSLSPEQRRACIGQVRAGGERGVLDQAGSIAVWLAVGVAAVILGPPIIEAVRKR